MNLNDTQKQQVAAWIEDGLRLSDIQKRLETEFGLRLTYLDTRLLVDDLKLVPKDQELPKAEKEPAKPAAPASTPPTPEPSTTPPTPGQSKVSVTMDQLTRPGAVVSGGVTFSDGQKATWYLDEMGRLGLVPAQPGYKPAPEDIQAFQRALQTEMQKMGY